MEKEEPNLLERNLLQRGNNRREDKCSVHDDIAAKSSHSFQDSWNSFQQPIKEQEKNWYKTTPWVRSHIDGFFEISGGLQGENEKSEMLAQKANAAMGALTTAETKVNKTTTDEKNTQEDSDQSPKYEPGISTNDNIVSIDRRKKGAIKAKDVIHAFLQT